MIYIITHKEFNNNVEYESAFYRVLHVGTNNCNQGIDLFDDTDDNISSKNPNYCELTGLYWIWKNGKEEKKEITGLVHYRRFFTSRFYDFLYTYCGIKPHILRYKKISFCLEKFDIILPIREKIVRTVQQSYCDIHHEEDLELTRETIKEVSPEYLNDFDYVMNSHGYYYANMMICRKELLDDYSKWLFCVLFNLEKKIDIDKYENMYQKRVFGFISERLLQVWVFHNKLKVKEYPVFNVESRRINFFQKNISRLKKLFMFGRKKNQ